MSFFYTLIIESGRVEIKYIVFCCHTVESKLFKFSVRSVNYASCPSHITQYHLHSDFTLGCC